MTTEHDSDVTNDKVNDPPAVSVGGYDVLRFDPAQDIPALSDLVKGYQSYGKASSEDGSWTDITDIGVDAVDLSLNVAGYMADPLNYLITAGLTFLVDVIQPLEDLLGLVTGNAERMSGEIAKWQRVANALGPLAEEIRTATDQGLIGWQGETAGAAKKRMHEFADGVDGIADDVKQLEAIMTIAQLIMSTAQALVLGIIGTLVEWLVITWVAAMAAAVPTFGASTAAAGAATGAEVAGATSRAVTVVDRVVSLLNRLRTVLTKVHPRMMARVERNFQLPNGRINLSADGWRAPVRSMLTGRLTWAPLGVQGAGGALDVTGTLTSDGPLDARPGDGSDPKR